MKKLILAGLAAMILPGCGEPDGSKLVGVWETNDAKMNETITVTTAGDGYRAIGELENPDMPYAKIEVMLKAESETLLVIADGGRKALELAADGTAISYLRSKEKAVSKVQ